MQHQIDEGIIARQHQVIQCSQCSLYDGKKGKQDFYICCFPFKISKIVCYNHRYTAKCQSCYAISAQIKFDLSRLDQKLFKELQIPQQKQPLPSNVIKAGVQCWLCLERLYDLRHTFKHIQCQKRYCYPCLYKVFSQQLKMFSSKDENLKTKYKMIMPCCMKEGDPISKVENYFSKQICVFRGCSASSNNTLVRVKNTISYCVSCLDKALDHFISSIIFIVEMISEHQHKECIYCEKPIELLKNINYYWGKAFNESLCPECYRKKINSFDQVLKSVMEFKAPLIEGPHDCCCNEQCHQKPQRIEILKWGWSKETVVSLKLIQWKDGKKYCGGCLYKKYQKIRTQFDSKNQSIQQFSQSMPTWDISRFESLKKCYQNHFIDRCMVCSKSQLMQSKFIRVNKGKKQQKNKLDCIYCNSCLELMQTNCTKYKQLLYLKGEIHSRESYFNKIQEQTEKQKKNMFVEDSNGCFPKKIFFQNTQVYPIKANYNENSTNRSKETEKPKSDFGISNKKGFHKEFPEFNSNQRNTMLMIPKPEGQIPQLQGDFSQIYEGKQIKQVFEEVISQEERLNIKAESVNTARIRPKYTVQSVRESHKPAGCWTIEWPELEKFEFIESVQRNKIKQGNKMRDTQRKFHDSPSIAASLLASGIIESIQSIKIQSTLEPSLHQALKDVPILKQACKVFSCGSLTGLMREQVPKAHYSRTTVRQQQRSSIKQSEQTNSQAPLMLGLMCSSCFVKYLLGEIKDDEIDNKDWEKAHQENARQQKTILNSYK